MLMLSRARGGLAALALVGALATAALLLQRQSWGAELEFVQRVSVATNGTPANQSSDSASLSADGRYIAFASSSTNLVPNDTIGIRDIFVRDRVSGTTERVSGTPAGTEANNLAFNPSISADGRYVAFASDANNLVSGDMNSSSDIFVRDRMTGTTTRVSVATGGAEGDNDSVTPSISGNGRYVTFTSLASNLVAPDTNNDRDVFLHDRMTGATELVSIATDGTQGNVTSGGFGAGPARISHDGRFVVYGSFANNLVTGDGNGDDDIFVRDRTLATTVRASVSSSELEGNGHSTYGSISNDGRYVVFHSEAPDLIAADGNMVADVFLRDLLSGATTRISEGPGGVEANAGSGFSVISGDGGVVGFQSAASNLIPNDGNPAGDIFRYDVASDTVTRVSVASGGGDANAGSSIAAISANGQVIAFQSPATNLVSGDTNNVQDIFTGTKLSSALDGDGDGCTNGEELGPNAGYGGRRDPLNGWDFFDTPPLDGTITIGDIVQVTTHFGGVAGPPPTGNYAQAFDRTLLGPDAWDLGAPNGSITVEDIVFAVTQFGHNCQGPA